MIPPRGRLALCGLLALAVFAAILTGATRGQPGVNPCLEPPPRAKPCMDAPKGGPTPLTYSMERCKTCHNVPKDEYTEVEKRFPLLCRLDEYKRWNSTDKHGDATLVLLAEIPPKASDEVKKRMEVLAPGRKLAAAMGERLQIPDVSKAPQCVSCHGLAATADLDPLLVKHVEGVTCAACHGAFDEWVDVHGSGNLKKRECWRSLTRFEKERDWGMKDLWCPVNRAELCSSCHIGHADKNPAKNRLVTHEMYAAGHPPLPGFEPATFSDKMPRHWEYLFEKERRIAMIPGWEAKQSEIDALIGYDGKKKERTELLVTGAVVSFRESVRLLEEQARDAAGAADPGKQVLDFANFDCYACHHELKVPSWRQAKGYRGTPGRPQMREWPTILVELALLHAEGDKGGTLKAEFQQKMATLAQAFNRRPFGDLTDVAAAAHDLVTWSDTVTARLSERGFEQKDVAALLQKVPGLLEEEGNGKKTRLLDYDSARQLGWAVEILCQDVQEPLPGPLADTLKEMETEIHLGLPSGKGKPVAGEVGQSLKRLYDYDSRAFAAEMERVGKALPR